MIRHSSIERRLSCILGLSALLITLLVSLSTLSVLHSKEQSWMLTQATKFSHITFSLLKNRFGYLRVFAEDYATNPDTFTFIDDANLDYLIGTHYRKGLTGAGADGMLLQDAEGGFLIGHTTYSKEIEQLLWSQLLNEPNLASFRQPDAGLILIGQRIFMYVAEPVRNPSAQDRQINGRFTVLLEQTSERINGIGAELGESLAIRVVPMKQPAMRFSFFQHPELQVNKLQKLTDYTDLELRLQAADGEVLPLFISIRFARAFSSLGSSLIWLLPQLIGILFICGLMLWLLRREITRPVTEIAEHLQQSVADFDYGITPLPAKTGRELQSLVSSINSIFARFAQQDRFRQLLLNSIGEVILVVDEWGHICYANPAAKRWLQMNDDALASCSLDYLLTNLLPSSPPVSQWLARLESADCAVHYRCRLRRVADLAHPVIAEVYLHPVQGDERDGAAVIIIHPTSADELADREAAVPADPVAPSAPRAVAGR